MSALGVVVLFLGSLVELFDLCAVLAASILIFIVCEELGRLNATLTYAVCAIISFLLLPSKIVAVEYILFGAYPVIRQIFEARSKPICISLKALYMLASATIMVAAARFLFTTGEMPSIYVELGTWALGVFCLVLCDIVFKRFSRYYNAKIRKMLRIDKFFKK